MCDYSNLFSILLITHIYKGFVFCTKMGDFYGIWGADFEYLCGFCLGPTDFEISGILTFQYAV